MKRKIVNKTILCILLLFSKTASSALEMLPVDDNGEDTQENVMPSPPPELLPSLSPLPGVTPSSQKWTAANFADQDHFLGWSQAAFAIPAGMEARVQFWQDIYSKYSSDQGVLHDSRHVSLVYESLDFTDITVRTDLTDRQKEKQRRNRVKEKKKEIAARLSRLQGKLNGEGLEGEDKRYWELFAKIDEAKKFSEAAGRRRLRFQLGQRNQILAGIYQSGRYLRQMEEVFRQEGLPVELTRLPFVESSFNLRARSKVGASGLWQFMRSSARVYLRMDHSADERNDPLSATRAAAKKLRENYQLLKSWPLAITAYNHGPSGIRRLTEKVGTTDIVELIEVRRGRFGFASANFFACFLAALEVERNTEKYFGPVEILPELRGAEIKIVKSRHSKDLLKWFSDLNEAQTLNPHVSPSVWNGKAPLTRKHIFRVPLLQESSARAELE